jgi:hypothetical protein
MSAPCTLLPRAALERALLDDAAVARGALTLLHAVRRPELDWSDAEPIQCQRCFTIPCACSQRVAA